MTDRIKIQLPLRDTTPGLGRHSQTGQEAFVTWRRRRCNGTGWRGNTRRMRGQKYAMIPSQNQKYETTPINDNRCPCERKPHVPPPNRWCWWLLSTNNPNTKKNGLYKHWPRDILESRDPRQPKIPWCCQNTLSTATRRYKYCCSPAGWSTATPTKATRRRKQPSIQFCVRHL